MAYLENNCLYSILQDSLKIFRKRCHWYTARLQKQ